VAKFASFTGPLLILSGPSGCGKNSLIRCFANDKKYKVAYAKDPKHFESVEPDPEDPKQRNRLPEDLDNLLDFISAIKSRKTDKVKQYTSGFAVKTPGV
jgi:DNA polymerase III delta prime subunit